MVRPNRRSSTPYYEIAVPMQTNFAAFPRASRFKAKARYYLDQSMENPHVTSFSFVLSGGLLVTALALVHLLARASARGVHHVAQHRAIKGRRRRLVRCCCLLARHMLRGGTVYRIRRTPPVRCLHRCRLSIVVGVNMHAGRDVDDVGRREWIVSRRRDGLPRKICGSCAQPVVN